MLSCSILTAPGRLMGTLPILHLRTLRLEVSFLQFTPAVCDGKAQNKALILFAMTFCPFPTAP